MAARRLLCSLYRYSLLLSPSKPSLYSLASVTAPPAHISESVLKDDRRWKIADELTQQVAIVQHKGTSSLSSQSHCAKSPTMEAVKRIMSHCATRPISTLKPRCPINRVCRRCRRHTISGKKRYNISLRAQKFSDQHQAVHYYYEFLQPFLKSNENLEDIRFSLLSTEAFNSFGADLDDDVAAEIEGHPDVVAVNLNRLIIGLDIDMGFRYRSITERGAL